MDAGGYRTQVPRQRLSRRRILRGTGLSAAGLSAVALLGCGREQRPEAVTGAAQPKRGGVLRASQGLSQVFRDGFDAHLLGPIQLGYLQIFYQGLIRANPRTFELEPDLAQRWEQPSQNEYIFTLQPGVKWHNKPPVNGRELTVDDVVFSLERVRTGGPRFLARVLLDTVEKIEAVDRSRIRITTKLPDVSAFNNLSAFGLRVLAPEAVERFEGKFSGAETCIGTGAFVLQSYQDQVSATAVRNPDYWKPGLPYLDEIRLQVIEDLEVRWSAFLAGQLDIMNAVPGNEAKKLSEQGQKNFSIEWFADVGTTSMVPNTRKPPFNDPRVTRALRLLIDHEEAERAWAEVWHGRAYRSTAFPAALADWDFSQEEYLTFLEWKRPKDEAVKTALDLLNAAGFNRSNPLRFTVTSYAAAGGAATANSAYSPLLQAQYRRLSQGVVEITEIRPFETAVLRSVLVRGDYDIGMTNQAPGWPFEPDSWLRTHYHSDGTLNFPKWSDPILDQMVDQQRAIFDVARRKAAVKEILRYLIENSPSTIWSGRYNANALYPRVRDWAPEASSATWGYQYERVWLDA